MAKSKIYAKLAVAVESYGQVYNHFLQNCHDGTIPDDVQSVFNARGAAVRAALAEADSHYAALEKRMGPDKSVGDRLRNLKNVFKDSTQLAAARAQVRKDLLALEGAFDAMERCIQMVVQFRQHG